MDRSELESGPRSPGASGRRPGVRGHASSLWFRESAGLALTFIVVSLLGRQTPTPWAAVAVWLGVGAELVFLWRWVWASLAVAASALPRGSQGLSRLVTAWGTKAAKKAVGGTVASTVLVGGLFSGVASAHPTPETADTLWSAPVSSVELPSVEHSVESSLPISAGSGSGTEPAGAPGFGLGAGPGADAGPGTGAGPGVESGSGPGSGSGVTAKPNTTQGYGGDSAPNSSPGAAGNRSSKGSGASSGSQGFGGSRTSAGSRGPTGSAGSSGAARDRVSTGGSPQKTASQVTGSAAGKHAAPVQRSTAVKPPTVRPEKTESQATPQVSNTYAVVAGDCLWNIAASHLPQNATDYDIDSLWREIYAQNLDLIGGNPDQIEPGMVLRLPRTAQSASTVHAGS